MLKLINLFQKTFIFLPLIYIGFSFIGEGNNSLHLEILYGIPFILFGVYFITEKNISFILIALLYFIHIVYDYYNEDLTNNIGVIYPYRQICSVYDFLVGCFLIYCAVYLNKKSIWLMSWFSFHILPLTNLKFLLPTHNIHLNK